MVNVPAGGVRVLAVRTQERGAGDAVGEQRLAVFLLNFHEQRTQPWTTEFVRAKYFTSPDSMAAYYQEQSFGKTTIIGDVLGWYTLPTTNELCDPNGFTTMANATARAAGVNLSQYTQYQYVIGPGAPCGWAGLAYVPGNDILGQRDDRAARDRATSTATTSASTTRARWTAATRPVSGLRCL